MQILTSIFFLHEHIITYYKIKDEALEAARHFEECFHRTMAQAFSKRVRNLRGSIFAELMHFEGI